MQLQAALHPQLEATSTSVRILVHGIRGADRDQTDLGPVLADLNATGFTATVQRRFYGRTLPLGVYDVELKGRADGAVLTAGHVCEHAKLQNQCEY